jgi:hypothetical protein
MYGLTKKRILVFIVLTAGMMLAAPAAAIEGLDSTAVSTAPINPDFLAYQENAEGTMLAASEDEGMYSSGLIPPPLDLSHISAGQSHPALFSAQDTLPSAYDLRSQERVTGVKNQGSYGYLLGLRISCFARIDGHPDVRRQGLLGEAHGRP